jgi:hypothetical protein
LTTVRITLKINRRQENIGGSFGSQSTGTATECYW